MSPAAKKKPRAPTRRKASAASVVAKPETVLVLRTCDSKLRSHGGSRPFQYPESGPVSAPDWKADPVCGYGLHGLLWGAGDGSLLSWEENAKWLVLEVEAASVVDLAGKVKFPRGVVVFAGAADKAVEYISQRAPAGTVIVRGTATAGYGGTATAGDGGTATAGVRGTATAGDVGTATAGNGGTATTGYGGTATAGDGGTATTGYGGTATAGNGGEIRIRWYDPKASRYRVAVGYVGEDGIEPKTAYVVEGAGKLAKKVAS